MGDEKLIETLIAHERAGLDLWARGDTPGYAAKLADHATYFDHVTRERLQGRPAIESHVRGFQGQVDIPRHEIVNPVLHHDGDIAILAFNWDPYDADGRLIARWNATSAYGHVDGEWRVIHMHWSMVPQQ